MRNPIANDILEMQVAAPFEPSVLKVFQVGGVQLHDNLRREVLPKMEPGDNPGVLLDLGSAQFTAGTADQAVKLLLRVIPIAGFQVVGLLRGSDINREMASKFNLELQDLPNTLRQGDQAAVEVVSEAVVAPVQIEDIDAAVFDIDAAAQTIRTVVGGRFDFGEEEVMPLGNELPIASFLPVIDASPVAITPVNLVDANTDDFNAPADFEASQSELPSIESPEVVAATEAPAFILRQARQILAEAEFQAVETVRQADTEAQILLDNARAAGVQAAAQLLEQARADAQTQADRIATEIKGAAEASARTVVEEARRAGQTDAATIVASARLAAAEAAEGILTAARTLAASETDTLAEQSRVAALAAATVILDEARAQGEAASALLTQQAQKAATLAAEEVVQTAVRTAEHQSAFIIDEARTIAKDEAIAILTNARSQADTEARGIVDGANEQAENLLTVANRRAVEGAAEVSKTLVSQAENEAAAIVTAARTQAESITAQAVTQAKTSQQAAEVDAVNIVTEALERASADSQAVLDTARQAAAAEAEGIKAQALAEATAEGARLIEQARITAEAATIRSKAQARQEAQAEATTILTTATATATKAVTDAQAEADRIVQEAVEKANAEAARIVSEACEEASSQGDRLLGDALQVVERVCRSANQVTLTPGQEQDAAVRKVVDDALSGNGYLPASRTEHAEAFAQASDVTGVQVDVRTALVHIQRVRTGAVVVAEDRDLVVVGPVSTGAELKADGNIHVYGSLHGKVMAGLNGNNDAQIFCQAFNGEYISIGDSFATFEQVPVELRGAAVRFWADATGIHYERLGQFA